MSGVKSVAETTSITKANRCKVDTQQRKEAKVVYGYTSYPLWRDLAYSCPQKVEEVLAGVSLKEFAMDGFGLHPCWATWPSSPLMWIGSRGKLETSSLGISTLRTETIDMPCCRAALEKAFIRRANAAGIW